MLSLYWTLKSSPKMPASPEGIILASEKTDISFSTNAININLTKNNFKQQDRQQI